MHGQIEPAEPFRRLPEQWPIARHTLGTGQPKRLAVLGVDIEHVAGEHSIAQHRRPSTFRQPEERSAFQNPNASIRPAPPAGSAVRGNVDFLQALSRPSHYRHSPASGSCLCEQFTVTPRHGIPKIAQPGNLAGNLAPLGRAVLRHLQSGQTPRAGDPEIRGARRHRREVSQARITPVPQFPPRAAAGIVFAQRIGKQHDDPAPNRRRRDQPQPGRRLVSDGPPAIPVYHQVSVDDRPSAAILPKCCPSAVERVHPVGHVCIG